ncbi:MAG: efflux RND transporter permease subunit [Lentimicrobiaceae bacterium]|nr:efflux RND transporter permease subunit [Lentimicrobiaceae bacterium]
MVTLKTVYGSDLIKRYNMFPCTTINITPQEGYSTCQAMNAAAIAAQELPTGFTYEYSGMTRDELKSGGQQMFVFALSFMLVFFILAALMESGAGAAENISIGISAAGGFLISTILGLLFVPVSFVIFKGLQERISKK